MAQKKTITEKAHEVTNISEKFQLIHATYEKRIPLSRQTHE